MTAQSGHGFFFVGGKVHLISRGRKSAEIILELNSDRLITFALLAASLVLSGAVLQLFKSF